MKLAIMANTMLLVLVVLTLTSCATQAGLEGLWQNTQETGSIEFKSGQKVIIVDNLSATVSGSYKMENNHLITFKITASDILRDSMQPSPTTVITAKVLKLDNNELHLHFTEGAEVESYQRIP